MTESVMTLATLLVYALGLGAGYAIGKHRGWDFEDLPPLLGLLFWPLTLPALGASVVTTRLLKRSSVTLPRASAREVRRDTKATG